MSAENLEEIDKIRNNIEFASIAQFFHTFQSAFHPWPAAYNPASFLATQTHLASQAAKRSDDDYVFATEVRIFFYTNIYLLFSFLLNVCATTMLAA